MSIDVVFVGSDASCALQTLFGFRQQMFFYVNDAQIVLSLNIPGIEQKYSFVTLFGFIKIFNVIDHDVAVEYPPFDMFRVKVS